MNQGCIGTSNISGKELSGDIPENIKPFLQRTEHVLNKIRKSYEIIFALDPSTDSTEKVILEEIKKSTNLPILRKDFIVDEYQIYESKLSGADCILIILSMLKQEEADKFAIIANNLDMDSIVEIHNLDELKRSNNMISNMIGINNRNLNNFETDLNTTIKLSKELQNNEKLFISESGFHRKEDIDIICKNTSINNFLIGEYLMKSQNLPSDIRELLN